MEIIKCHGSGNDFIMVDTTRDARLQHVDWSAFARIASDREHGIGSDGILLVVRHDDGIYGMDMLNPDGTHAEMCGNGIRCVARLAYERGYVATGILRSGGRDYRIARAEDIAEGIPAFKVDIPIRTHSDDFAFYRAGESFVGRIIEGLHPSLRFTALNLGNPHIVAEVETIDLALLSALGERVKGARELFPHGVNVSLYERREGGIFVATYERGAGITLSCGTAMTASATAAALLGIVNAGERIEVSNRGGRVYCTTRTEPVLTTTLEGNATYEWTGRAEFAGGEFMFEILTNTGEAELWLDFVRSINR
ncbi:MAG: diaminopimelate epimerase [Alistipes sp.]|nr:diaminopimelate epimerase [Alistipes sp.]